MREIVDAGVGPAVPRSAPALLDVVVAALRPGAAEIRVFDLVPADGQRLPPAAPGAHIDVFLPSGLVRQYSVISSGAELTTYEIAVARDDAGRGGSREMHDALAAGSTLRISAPRNNFPLAEDSAHSIFIAGGIGITAVLPMVRQLAGQGASWELHYSCRARRRAAFLEELSSLGAGVSLYFGEDGPVARADIGAIVATAPPAAHFYCCGPSRMLSAFTAATSALPPENVHFERFGPAEPAGIAGGFWIELHRSQKNLYVSAGKTILDVLLEAGIEINRSCEMGLCGTCEVAVLNGIPDHRDDFLSPRDRASNQRMMVCCSGSLSERLVLDV